MSDPRIDERLRGANAPLLSLEFFPPADDRGWENLRRAAAALRAAQPDFVTVTWGAAGTAAERSFEVGALLRGMGYGPVMPHLTCIGRTRRELEAVVDRFHASGHRNLMVLRGDPPKGEGPFRPPPDGLGHASDLVGLVLDRRPDVCCGVAGYPEVHPEARSPELDLLYLKTKLMSGASFVTTQLFFDNTAYFDFVERCRRAGIYQPILPGLLPAVSLAQVRRITQMCRARLPEQLEVDLEDAGGSGEAAEAVGIRWAATQIRGLLERGVPGIHLYILNRARTALAPELTRVFAPVRGQAAG